MYTLEQLEQIDAQARAESMDFSNGFAFANEAPQYTQGYPSLTVKQFLKRPDLILHRMLDIAQKGFIVDALLQGGYQPQGGLIAYTRSESLYTARDPEEIPEGGYYPVTGDVLPAIFEERVRKYGLKTFLTEEAVKRNVFPMVERELLKLKNTIIKYLDGLFLNKIRDDTSIQSRAAAAAWTVSATTIFQDIENARADIRNLYEGYEPDTLVLHPSKVIGLTANTTFGNAYNGNMANQNPIFTGQLPPMFGLDIMVTPNLKNSNGTAATYGLMMQRKIIGGIAEETPLQVKALPFNEDNDTYWLKGRRVVATFLTDPQAVVKITGI